MTRPAYAYLTLLSGDRAGRNFALDASAENSIGRGASCSISLPDRLCSRVHAIITCADERWAIRDVGSRNGTLVDGERVESMEIEDGATIRVGETELDFRLSDQPMTTEDELGWTMTIVQDAPVSSSRSGMESSADALAALPDAEQVRELILLYQMSIRLLGCDQPDQVVRVALDLLHERTRAAIVGFLWVNDAGKLAPKLVIPPDEAEQVALSQSLTDLVVQQGRAVWVANQGDASSPGGVEHFADAVCAPLVHRTETDGRQTVGAIHVYLQDGRFRQSDFDFTISVANIVTVALVRAQQITSLQTNYKRLVASQPPSDEIIGQSPAMVDLKSKIARIARATGCVLIRGESGTGKELVARAIHRESARAGRSMVAVNCAAIPAELMESQLFGHKQGSFTGADRDHVGYFQQADMGTLFLDEVGELTLAGQAKLLRILEGHPFLPVGATDEVSVDVRVLAATNQDLAAYVREKKFREDLYYRLSVFELHVPPLRDRGDDVGLLVDKMLDHFRTHHGRPGLQLSGKARQQLINYAWPGNVRQLRNVLDSAVVLAEGNNIEATDLALRDTGLDQLETLKLEEWEKKLIREALKRARRHVPEAAKLLGIGRATLYRRLEQYGIEK